MMTSSMENMSSEVELGLPFGRNIRLRLVRRLLIKLLWPALKHQVSLNRAIRADLVAMNPELEELRGRMDRIAGDLEHHSSVLSRHEEGLADISGWKVHAASAEAHLAGLQAHAERTSELIELAQRQAFARHQDGMGAIRRELADLAQQIDTARVQSEIADLRIRMAAADLFVNEFKRAMPDLPSPERIAQLPSAFDELYGAFEDAFRGSEQVIKERVRTYIDDLPQGLQSGSIVDVGSGRGEWLQVLKERGIASYGVEINEQYVQECARKGLDVRLGDAIAHLKSVPEGTLVGVTAIQVVEHLDVDQIIELIDRSIAALQPGGVLIFETPNPDNLTVGASSFYIDPTHRHPLPSALLAFLVSCRGMIDVETRYLNRPELEVLRHPNEEHPWNRDLAGVINAVNNRLYSAQDYAVIAYRP